MKVSVLITNYNYQDYVVAAVKSALDQTYPPHEVIVVDDGSTDASRERLETTFKDNPSVKLIFQANQGQMTAFNAAYAASSGDILCLLDSDDLYKPQYLEQIVEIYTEHRYVDAILCNVEYTGLKHGTQDFFPATGPIGYGAIRAAFDKEWPGGPPSAFSFRQKIAERVFPIPPELCELSLAYGDVPLVYGSLISGAFRYYLAEPLVYYRLHLLQTTTDDSKSTGFRIGQYFIARVQGFYLQKFPLAAYFACGALAEFRLQAYSTRREARTYSRITWASPMPWWKRLRDVVKIYLYLIKSSLNSRLNTT